VALPQSPKLPESPEFFAESSGNYGNYGNCVDSGNPMIALLRGNLIEKHPSRLIVDVGGVGYDVLVPLSTFYVVGELGAGVTLRVHTHVREDVIALYGFASELEHDLFERLIAINGIGPKLALAVLSGIEPAELIKAIRLQDVARLTAIPGIGKKTAERIGLEMKDRLPAALQAAGQEPAKIRPEDQLRDDLLSALINLGYQRPAAEKAIDKTLQHAADAPFDQALRGVLRALMKT
jgi:Holliday junction DNA helicase RuvA